MEKHLLFSDESGYCGRHRYGSIAVISGSKSNTKDLNERLNVILDRYDKKELKFSKIKGHSNTMQSAKEFIKLGMQYCCESKIKIHVIIWDTMDSRHQVFGRDDIGNMVRMYYHILKKAQTDWKGIENWEFYPDEFTSINWQSDLIKYVEKTNLDKEKNSLNTIFNFFPTIRIPSISKHRELESDAFPILQLSDLFAGLVRLSYESGDLYNQWLSYEMTRNSLFPDLVSCKASNNQKCKFKIMRCFQEVCSKYKMGVNFSENKYFKTFSDKTGIFIWLYKPQGEYDKAPTNRAT